MPGFFVGNALVNGFEYHLVLFECASRALRDLPGNRVVVDIRIPVLQPEIPGAVFVNRCQEIVRNHFVGIALLCPILATLTGGAVDSLVYSRRWKSHLVMLQSIALAAEFQ